MADFFRIWKEGGLGLTDFWAQHNEHRIPTLKFIMWVDLLLENGSGYFIVFLIFLFQFLHLALMGRALGREPRLDSAAKMFFIGMAAFLFFWLRQRENFVWTFQVGWPLNALMVSGAAYLVAGLDADLRGKTGRTVISLIAAALACLVAATTLASGLLFPVVLAVLLWKLRMSRSVLVTWVVFCGLLFAAYLTGYTSPSHHGKPSEAFVVDTVLYFFVFLGNPVAINGIPFQAAFLPGLAVLGSYLWLSVRFIRGPKPLFLDLFVFAVSTQIIMMAALTAVGRHTFGLHQASAGRYSMPVLILWFVLTVWGFVSVASHSRTRTWMQRAVVLLVLLFVLPTQALLVPRTLKMYRIYDESSLALMAGVEDTVATNRAYPYPERMWELNAIARKNALTVYRAEWTRWPRDGVGNSGLSDTLAGVRAVITERRAAGTPERPGYYVSGRLVPEAGIRIEAYTDFLLTRGHSIVGYARAARRPCNGCFTGYVLGGAEFDLNTVVKDAAGEFRAVFIP